MDDKAKNEKLKQVFLAFDSIETTDVLKS